MKGIQGSDKTLDLAIEKFPLFLEYFSCMVECFSYNLKPKIGVICTSSSLVCVMQLNVHENVVAKFSYMRFKLKVIGKYLSF